MSSEFIQYLVSYPPDAASDGGSVTQLPPLSELSKELGISIAGLREQLEVAEAIGLVEVKPRIGIRRLPYTFLPAVRQSLTYAIAFDQSYFNDYSNLRNHIEAAYWDEASRMLLPEDHDEMHGLMEQAWGNLRGQPIRIPHDEHRQLHLLIYRRLENPFVQGLLEAFWETYEAVGLNLYADYNYLRQVWTYHQKMVDAICDGNFVDGYQALVEHKDLLHHRPDPHNENRTESLPA